VLGLLATVASATGTPGLAILDPLVYAAGSLVTLLASLAYQISEQGSPWIDRLRGQ
jgi:hypothetical protein